jgi:toxin-antitoxin system PIN domain toxin
MILVDANLLLYAEDSLSEHHDSIRSWWDEKLSGTAPVCLCWPVLTAFIRIATNPRLHQRPLSLREACERVQSWLAQPCVRLIHPGENHWSLFQKMLKEGNAVGNVVSDAQLAALAFEHNCVLQSADTDFARFASLKWNNPISES